MAEIRDAHVVEIPVDEEHRQKNQSTASDGSLIQHHPLMEISQSPGHLLLLKLWQREEDLFARRIALKEARLDGLKREVFQLCCFFFAFHGFHLTLLFTSSIHRQEGACRKWWLPAFLSFFTSLVIIFLVQLKLFRYLKVSGQLQRERSDNRALVRCIQELRMKGGSFDLSKEPQTAKRMKSSSVEIKWKPKKWFSENVVTICLVCFTEKQEEEVVFSFGSNLRRKAGRGNFFSFGSTLRRYSYFYCGSYPEEPPIASYDEKLILSFIVWKFLLLLILF